MTVKDLIEKLMKYDLDAEVIIVGPTGYDNWSMLPYADVVLNKAGKVEISGSDFEDEDETPNRM